MIWVPNETTVAIFVVLISLFPTGHYILLLAAVSLQAGSNLLNDLRFVSVVVMLTDIIPQSFPDKLAPRALLIFCQRINL